MKVLIIDDDPAFLNVITESLHEQGFQVFSVSKGDAGVLLAETEHPDIILLDLILPDVPGLEVLRSLKDNLKTASIPVVMITSYGNDQVETEANTLGVAGYLLKFQMQMKDIGPYILNILAKKEETTSAAKKV